VHTAYLLRVQAGFAKSRRYNEVPMKVKQILAAAALTTFALLATVGCEEHQGPAERAEKMDKGIEKAGEKLEDAGDKMKDAAHDATH
jgi:hypothetical protein